jgi:hypothetical protein
MLSKDAIKNRLIIKIIISILLLALANCNYEKIHEKTFSLYLDKKSYRELMNFLQAYSLKYRYDIKSESLTGDRPETSSERIMLERNETHVLIQSALAEQCSEREGRRDVEYSRRVFDVNAFSTSYLWANSDLSKNVEHLRASLKQSGFRIVSREDSCSLL